ncbi:MAG: zinc-binding dehydrogenase [Patescibacteria group bacterium]
MKAIIKKRPVPGQKWYEGLEIKEKPEPQITKDDEVKIKVLAASICGTDVSIYKGTLALQDSMANNILDEVIIGHEFCGQIEEAGISACKEIVNKLYSQSFNDPKITDFLLNNKKDELVNNPELLNFLKDNFYVTAEMHIVCWQCHQCLLGEGHVCQNTKIKGLHQDGAFTKYVVVPVSNLLLFAKGEIPLEIIAFMDAIGNATHTIQSAEIKKGSSVLVLGAGIQGLMSIAIAKQLGASVIFLTDASNPNNNLSSEKLLNTKFALAKKLGADYCFDVTDESNRKILYEQIKKETNNTGVDAVLEMSGSYVALEDALKNIRMGGIVALLGLPSGAKEIDFSKDIIFRGITIKGVIGRRMFSTWELMRSLLTNGLSQIILDNKIISHDLPLEDFQKGFDAIRSGDAYKIILRP